MGREQTGSSHQPVKVGSGGGRWAEDSKWHRSTARLLHARLHAKPVTAVDMEDPGPVLLTAWDGGKTALAKQS